MPSLRSANRRLSPHPWQRCVLRLAVAAKKSVLFSLSARLTERTRLSGRAVAMTATSAEFEKATDFRFREENIERARALVGRWSPSAAPGDLTPAPHHA